MYKHEKKQTLGFTLIELSIVILIIGFVIAGVASATSLIKTAKLNSVISDMQSYQTAYNSFLARYGAPPGDFSNGSDFWPDCSGEVNYKCIGNSNGLIDVSSYQVAGGGSYGVVEASLASRELYLSGLSQNHIVPVTSSAGSNGTKGGGGGGSSSSNPIGTSFPASKVEKAGYTITQGNDTNLANNGANTGFTGSTGLWNDKKTNAIFIGSVGSSGAIGYLVGGALNADDAFYIDRKVDDGMVNGSSFVGASTGNVRVFEGVGTTSGDCLVGGNSSTSTTYNISSTNTACVLAMALN